MVALDTSGNPVTADDLGVGGAMSILMKEAIKVFLIIVSRSNL